MTSFASDASSESLEIVECIELFSSIDEISSMGQYLGSTVVHDDSLVLKKVLPSLLMFSLLYFDFEGVGSEGLDEDIEVSDTDEVHDDVGIC